MVEISGNGLTSIEQFYLMLPILVSSATLLQLPSASHTLLNRFRALQLYDSQEVDEEEKEKAISKAKTSKLRAHLVGLSSFVLILGPELFLFATVDTPLCPTLSFLRDHVVQYYMCVIGLPVIFSLIPTSQDNVFVGRTDPKAKSAFQVKSIHNFKMRIPSMQFFALTLLPTFYVISVLYIPIKTLIVPTFLALCLSYGLVRQPVVFRKFSSFRGLVLGPIIYLMFCACVSAAIIALVVLIEKKGNKGGSTSSHDTYGEALDSDKNLEKLLYAVRPYLWTFCNLIPAGLITLAYRYDSLNAGHTLIQNKNFKKSSEDSEEKATEAIQIEVRGEFTSAIVSKDFDGQGKRPVQLSSISLPKLAFKETPIFNVGLLAFFVTHLISFTLMVFLPSDYQIFEGSLLIQENNGSKSSPSRIAMESLFSAFPPGWAATLLVPLVMMARACWTEQGVGKLWNYHEKWGVDAPKKVDVIKEKETGMEESQSLLADIE